jgi:hypothetical protein
MHERYKKNNIIVLRASPDHLSLSRHDSAEILTEKQEHIVIFSAASVQKKKTGEKR